MLICGYLKNHLPATAKHPFTLPDREIVTEQIIDEIHVRGILAAVETTLSLVRQKFGQVKRRLVCCDHHTKPLYLLESADRDSDKKPTKEIAAENATEKGPRCIDHTIGGSRGGRCCRAPEMETGTFIATELNLTLTLSGYLKFGHSIKLCCFFWSFCIMRSKL